MEASGGARSRDGGPGIAPSDDRLATPCALDWHSASIEGDWWKRSGKRWITWSHSTTARWKPWSPAASRHCRQLRPNSCLRGSGKTLCWSRITIICATMGVKFLTSVVNQLHWPYRSLVQVLLHRARADAVASGHGTTPESVPWSSPSSSLGCSSLSLACCSSALTRLKTSLWFSCDPRARRPVHEASGRQCRAVSL